MKSVINLIQICLLWGAGITAAGFSGMLYNQYFIYSSPVTIIAPLFLSIVGITCFMLVIFFEEYHWVISTGSVLIGVCLLLLPSIEEKAPFGMDAYYLILYLEGTILILFSLVNIAIETIDISKVD